MDAATGQAPRHAACHPQTGVHQELVGQVEVRAAVEPREAQVGPVGLAGALGGQASVHLHPLHAGAQEGRWHRLIPTPVVVPSVHRLLMLGLRKMLQTRTAWLQPMLDSHAACQQANLTIRALWIPTVWVCLLVILA